MKDPEIISYLLMMAVIVSYVLHDQNHYGSVKQQLQERGQQSTYVFDVSEHMPLMGTVYLQTYNVIRKFNSLNRNKISKNLTNSDFEKLEDMICKNSNF